MDHIQQHTMLKHQLHHKINISYLLYSALLFFSLAFIPNSIPLHASEISGSFSTSATGGTGGVSSSGGGSSQFAGQLSANVGANSLQGNVVGGVQEGSSQVLALAAISNNSGYLTYPNFDSFFSGEGQGGLGNAYEGGTIDVVAENNVRSTDTDEENSTAEVITPSLPDTGNTAASADTGIKPGWLIALAVVAVLLIVSIGYTLSMPSREIS
jgi:hypothetical protein